MIKFSTSEIIKANAWAKHIITFLPRKVSNYQSGRQSGMTIIEILIVVAIISILAAFAAPSYSKLIMQQRRADAHHLLKTNAQRLQRCLTLAGDYQAGCNLMTTSAKGHYTVIATRTAQTWTMTALAVPDGKQLQDTDCEFITLSHTGHKSATGNRPETCW